MSPDNEPLDAAKDLRRIRGMLGEFMQLQREFMKIVREEKANRDAVAQRFSEMQGMMATALEVPTREDALAGGGQ